MATRLPHPGLKDAALFELLEPRTLMAAYTASPILDAPADIAGANDARTILFTSSDNPTAGHPAWLQQARINGQWGLVYQMPGFGLGSLLSDADNSGRLLGFTPDPYHHPTWFFVINGVRTSIADAVQSWVGGVGDPAHMTIAAIADNGWSLLTQEHSTPDGRPWSWRLKDGVATFVGEFRGTINSQGTVLPRFAFNADPLPQVLFLADGSQVSVPGLQGRGVISDTGTVAWLDGATLLVRANGVTTSADLGSLFLGQLEPTWTVTAVNDSGLAIATFRESFKSGGSVQRSCIYDPARGVQPFDEAIWGSSESPFLVALSIDNDGSVLTNDRVLAPIDERDLWASADGAPLSASASSEDSVVAGINRFGDGVLLTRAGTSWVGFRLRGANTYDPQPGGTEIRRLLAYIDPVDGLPSVFVITSTKTLWGHRVFYYLTGYYHSFGVREVTTSPPSTAIIENAALFDSGSGRVNLTGTDASGDLILFYTKNSTIAGDTNNWSYTNLTTDHLQASGKTFTPVASGLTAFVSPWGATHVAYLDSAGNVQVVWWAPGMNLWTTDNLSPTAGAPPLHGSLTSYVTAWNGLNIAGTDSDGNLVALWWVPQFGTTWHFDRYAGDDAAKLDPDSLTSFATPWGGLSVVGLNTTTREITVYWWTPASNEWKVEPVGVTGRPSSITARSAPVAATPTPDGLLQIYFADDNLHLARLFWSPTDGALWNFEDITQAV